MAMAERRLHYTTNIGELRWLKEHQKNHRKAKKSQYMIIKKFFNCDIIIN